MERKFNKDSKLIQNEQENLIELKDKVVHIRRVAKVVKGGRRFSFSAIVVVGDEAGRVGYGLGKANEVPDAIRKATENPKINMIKVPIVKGGTIPHDIFTKYGATKLVMKPASKGTGIIAGGAVRAVMEMAGINNILTKVIGSRNSHNIIKAVFKGFSELKSFEQVARERGIPIEELYK